MCKALRMTGDRYDAWLAVESTDLNFARNRFTAAVDFLSSCWAVFFSRLATRAMRRFCLNFRRASFNARFASRVDIFSRFANCSAALHELSAAASLFSAFAKAAFKRVIFIMNQSLADHY